MDIAYVTLTDGRQAIVDAEDYAAVAAYRWRAQGSRPGNDYATTSVGRPGKSSQTIRMHRMLTGAEPGQIVDHINGDRLDNRRSNLRITDAAGNSQNAGKRRQDSFSRFKGVSTAPARNKGTPYKVVVRCAGRMHYVGIFKDEIEAARAYDRRAVELHGPFAKTNVDLGLLPPI